MLKNVKECVKSVNPKVELVEGVKSVNLSSGRVLGN